MECFSFCVCDHVLGIGSLPTVDWAQSGHVICHVMTMMMAMMTRLTSCGMRPR